jgi:uncharacterized OB-fold protein
VSADPTLLEILGGVEISDPTAATWRLSAESTTQTGDERFISEMLLVPALSQVVESVLEGSGQTAADVLTAVFSAPIPGCARAVAESVGVDAAACNGASAVDTEIGFAGVAAPLVEFMVGVGERNAGDLVLMAAGGDGASALIGRVLDSGAAASASSQVITRLAERRPLEVGLWLRLRSQLPLEPVNPSTSRPLMWREADTMWHLTAGRCSKCGQVDFPPRRICRSCRSKDAVDDIQLPHCGTLFTHTTEFLYPVPEGRLLMGVIDLGPCHFYTQITDTDTQDCVVGSSVDLALRRLHNGGGEPHYFWKAIVKEAGSNVE